MRGPQRARVQSVHIHRSEFTPSGFEGPFSTQGLKKCHKAQERILTLSYWLGFY